MYWFSVNTPCFIRLIAGFIWLHNPSINTAFSKNSISKSISISAMIRMTNCLTLKLSSSILFSLLFFQIFAAKSCIAMLYTSPCESWCPSKLLNLPPSHFAIWYSGKWVIDLTSFSSLISCPILTLFCVINKYKLKCLMEWSVYSISNTPCIFLMISLVSSNTSCVRFGNIRSLSFFSLSNNTFKECPLNFCLNTIVTAWR